MTALKFVSISGCLVPEQLDPGDHFILHALGVAWRDGGIQASMQQNLIISEKMSAQYAMR
jgi:hypothetical protein